MAVCEMCGKDAYLSSVNVEGVELKVCPNCSKYGTKNPSLERRFNSRDRFKQDKSSNRQEVEWKIIENFSILLKKARDEKHFTQEQFAKFINERESVLQKWENGDLKPRIDVARKLEQILNLNLVVKDNKDTSEGDEDLTSNQKNKKAAEEFTLGDFIKIRKK
ncbi:TIGR00270 family protein [Candidatus Woesearchaeota archaeon CG_4_10_14_0_2_um_filter_33_13]|nr:MAG: TIGR00270 family protein [Candidatus Woesearchaeota archaeon CG_4_10_14_0_2_um_filter_33_13]